MRHALWILAAVTLAIQFVLLLFGGMVVRALASMGWSLFLLGIRLNLMMDALLVVTVIAGVYAAGKAHRGGWVALFCVALVLSLYGPFLAGFAVAYAGLGRLGITFVEALDLALEVLVPLVALAYALRYRSQQAAPGLAGADGA